MGEYGRIAGRGVPKPVRAIMAIGALVAVLWMVAAAIASYQEASFRSRERSREATQAPSGEATGAAESSTGSPAQETGGEGGVAVGSGVVVLVDGLNLRERPSTGSPVVKRLNAGQRLLLLEEGAGWYRVRDMDGSEGWVAAGGSYTRLER
jgi:uncharacterized protein YgiM (DUF1202 family)